MPIIPVKTGPTAAPVVQAYWTGGVVMLTTRKPDGGNETRRVPAEFVSYFKARDVEAYNIDGLLRADGRVASMRAEGEWLRVRWRSREDCFDVCTRMHDKGITTYEGDVDPVLRYLTESNAEIATPRRAFIDLETDSRAGISKALAGEARILAWALVDDDGERVVGVLEGFTDRDERELLLDLFHELKAYEQIVGWNLDGFDKLVLAARAKALGLNVEQRIWQWLDHMAVFKRMNISASKSGDEKQSMALNAVAKSLGVGSKLEGVDGSKTFELWENDRERLAAYVLQDTELMPAIEAATGYLAIHQIVCETCGVIPDSRGLKPTRFVDGYMLRKARASGIRFPTKFKQDREFEEDQFAGAFVMAPTKTGIVKDVHVGDFKSMYPSIMISFNMSPETHDPDVVLYDGGGRPSYLAHVAPVRKPIPPGYCAAPDDTVFRVEPVGMFPAMCIEMLELRKVYSDKRSKEAPGTAAWKDYDRRATAMKAVPNSAFGVTGNEHSRYHLWSMAQAITQTGAWLIKQTMTAAEARALFALYGDTDSVFIVGGTNAEFVSFVKHCNDVLYPELLAKQGCRENRIKLGYEKKFERIVILTKKRYAGRFEHYDGKPATEDSAPEIKGLEYKRGDVARLARQMQTEVLDLMLGGGLLRKRVETCEEDPNVFHELVKRWRARILEAPLELADVQLSKGLSRDVRGYAQKTRKDGSASTQPAHVRVAKMLEARGESVGEGSKIAYVVLDDSESPQKVIPASDYDGTCDRFYLWETLVYPPTMRVLEAAFPGERWQQYERVRPPKLTGAAARAAKAEKAGQRSLF